MATRKIFANQEFQPSASLVNPKVHVITDLSQHSGSVGQLVTYSANLYFHDGSNWFTLIESNYSGNLTGAPNFDPSSGSVPFTVGSGNTGRVDNLNADYLDGYDTSTTATSSAIPVYGSGGVLNVGTPTGDTHAATKLYVDNAIQGLDIKPSVAAATTASITLSGNQTIDGVSITAGMRVLVKDQSTASENGIYVSSASSWALAEDSDSGSLSAGAYVFVENGTTHNNTGWTYVNDGAYTWVQFSGAGQITAGDGLTKTGDTLNASVASPLSISNDQITIADGAISGVKLDSAIAGDGLAYTTGVLSVNVSAPLSISADTLSIADGAIGGAKLNTAIAGDGLGISAGVLSVNTAGPISIVNDDLTIADGAITGAKLNSAIAGNGIGYGSGVMSVNVTGPITIVNDLVTIQDGALTGAKLADNTVTSTQLANSITVTDLLVQDVSLATLIVGSTGGAGAEIILDGAANGDGSGGDFAYIKMTSGDDLHIVNQQTAGTMLFATGSVTRATIAADGKVKLFQNTGIGGDPSSTYTLYAYGDSKIGGTLEVSTPTANAHAATKSYVDSQVSAATPSVALPISYNASSEITIADQAITGAKLANNTVTSTQLADTIQVSSLGVGVSPSLPLDVYSSSGGCVVQFSANLSNAYEGSILKLKGGNLATNKIMLGDVSDEDIGAINYANNGNTMTFDVNASTRLTIESDGDVKVHERLGVGGTPVSVLSLVSGSRTLDFELKDTPASGDQGIQLIGGSGDSIGIAAGGTGPGLVLDTSNRLGIRTDSMSTQDSTADDLVIGDGLGHYGITLYSAATYKGTIAFGDPNSNYQGAIVYDHNNDSLALFTGGTSRLSIDSSGNGSITGTFSAATPTATGHLATKGYVDSSITNNAAAVAAPVSFNLANQITIADGALTGAKLANNTVTSTQLADDITLSSLDVSGGHINISNDYGVVWGGGTGRPYIIGNKTNGTIAFGEGGSELMLLDTSGNLKLSGDESELQFNSDTQVGNNIRARIKCVGVSSTYGYGGDLLFFTTADNNTSAERMRLTSTGLGFPDSTKVKLGSGDDLQIYHDGSNGYIDNNTGQLFINKNGPSNAWTCGGEVGFLNAAGTEYLVRATSNGSVKLYYDDSRKFETSSTGVSVTGSAYIQGVLSITGDGSNAVTFTESGAGLMTIATADDLVIDAAGDIRLDADGGDVRLNDNGVNIGRLGLENGDLNIASEQQDYDVRIKGNDGGSIITALHFDMSDAGTAIFNNKVGIGASPDTILDIKSADPILTMEDSSATSYATTNARINFNNYYATVGYIQQSGETLRIASTGGVSSIQLSTAGSDRVTISSAGDVAINATPSSSYKLYVNGTGGFSGNVTIGTGIIKTSIGGDIAITQGAIGLRINDAASAISPTTATVNNDNAVDLGVDNIRFRNIYLAGTLTNDGSGGVSVDTSGNVGISTTSFVDTRATRGLHLANATGIAFQSTSSNANSRAWRIRNDDLADWGSLNFAVGTTNSDFADAASDVVMTLLRNGNVGIGTTSPSAKLEISSDGGSSQNTVLIIKSDDPNGDQTGSSTADIDFYIWDSNTRLTTPQARIGIVGGEIASQNIEAAGRLAFYTSVANYGSPGLVERMRIDPDGNVAIGSQNAWSRLWVERDGIDLNNDWSFEDASSVAHLTLAGQNSHVRLHFGTMDVSPYAGYIQAGYDNTPDTGTGSTGIEPLLLNPKGGDVGIGLTGIPNSKLHVVQTGTGEAFRIDGANSGFAMIVEGGTSYKTRMRGGVTIGSGYGSSTPPSNGLLVEGSVGIGTTSPSAPLHLYQPSSTGMKFGRSGHDTIELALEGSNRFVINNDTDSTNLLSLMFDSGNVGIGTTSPDGAKLVIGEGPGANNLRLLGRAADGWAFMQFRDASNTTNYAEIGARSTELRFYQGGTQYQTVVGGNVGIGTASPYTKLQVLNTLGIYSGDTTTGGQIYLGTSDFNNANYYNSAAGIGAIISTGTSQPNGIGFYTYTGSSNSRTERMRLESNGRLGLGTASPASTLHVNGQSFLIGANYGVYGNNDSTNYRLFDNGGGRLVNNWYGGHIWQTMGGTERMQLSSAGSLGINCTPSSTVKLHVNGNSLVTSASYIGDTTRWFQSDSNGLIKLISSYGYLRFGADNTSWCHFLTDRPKFYFDKGIHTTGEHTVSYTNAFQTVNGLSGYGYVRVYGNNNGVEVQMDANGSNSGGATIGTFSSSNLYFKTANGNRGVILSNGYWGVGTVAPSYQLHVAGDAYASSGFLTEQTTSGGYRYRTSNSWGGWNRAALTMQDGSGNQLYSIGGYGSSGTSLSYGWIGRSYTDHCIRWYTDAGVYLRYDNVDKLEIDANGAQVSGRLNVTGNADVAGTLDVSAISINGTTTASRYLGTNSSGTLEWKTASSNPYITNISVGGFVSSNTDWVNVNTTLTYNNGATISDSATIVITGITCPTDCATGS